jgi:hypothetical protein
MVSFTSIFTTLLVVVSAVGAKPVAKSTEQPVVTYLGTQGPILCMLRSNVLDKSVI